MLAAALGWLVPATISAAVPEARTVAAPLEGPVAEWPEVAELPVEPATRVGRLENGLTFYVRRNARPEKRADLWLAVDVGSTLEDDDQQGLAHFVEHMAFNGTEKFPKQAIIDYFERIGMKFGPEVNAFTSFDQTVYMLRVPTDDQAIAAQGLQVLEQWARAVSFDGQEIDKERGVLVEEWRLGRGAEARMRDRQIPVLFRGSRYAERLVIGKKEVLEKASHETIRRFYRDWYRPDLMAVIAVGDFDPAAMQRSIEERFAPLRNPPSPRPRSAFLVPDHAETLVSIASDAEATSARLSVYSKLPHRELRTVADYRRMLVEGLYHRMVNERLNELRQRPDPPFLYAFSSSGGFVRTRDVVSQGVGVDERGLARGLETLLEELLRVDRHGFGAAELERARKRTLRFYEQAWAERDTEEHDAFTQQILSLFLEREAMPGIEVELALARRLLPTVTLEELNHLARLWSGEQNRVILVNGPEKAGLTMPTEAQVLGTFRAVRSRLVPQWVDRTRPEPLVSTAPKATRVVEESAIPELGVTRWRLGNGVVVLLKPTDFKKDEVLLSAVSPGGHSLVPDARYVSATYAAQALAEGGLGSFDRVELQKALAGKIASAQGYVGDTEEGLRGMASPLDLETMLQLAYLQFTAPRKDAAAFGAWLQRTRSTVANRLARPETVFSDRMQVELSQGHFRRRPVSQELLGEIDLDAALAVWRDRFGDAGDFTFVLVGAFDPVAAKPLVETWLGGLPSAGRQETWKDVGVRPPASVVRVEVKKGIEPKSTVRMTFTGEAVWSREAAHLMDSLGDALSIRLREVLREDMGGTYGAWARGALSRRPTERYSFTLSFGCDPQRVPEMQAAVDELVAKARKDGFSEDVLVKVREQQRRTRETDLRENRFWSEELLDSARHGDDPRQILRFNALIELVTAERLRDAARAYLDPARQVIGVLYPEDRPPATDGMPQP